VARVRQPGRAARPATLDRLEQEPHAIHDVLEGVDRALVAFVSGPDGMPNSVPRSTW
jgi:hypothetical protein